MSGTWDRDASGEKYSHPERSCNKCKKLQSCIEHKFYIPEKSCNFAKYGCRKYKE